MSAETPAPPVKAQAKVETLDDEEEIEDDAEPVSAAAAETAVPVDDENEEDEETEAEPPVSPSVELVTQPEVPADTHGEGELIAHSEASTSLNLKTDETTEKPAIHEAELPPVPKREVIRIEKSSESFTHLHTAIEYAVGNPNFHTDGLTDSSLFSDESLGGDGCHLRDCR